MRVQVEGLVELLPLRDALVGVPGVNGLSVEQRKRLTIAVELVANPGMPRSWPFSCGNIQAQQGWGVSAKRA